MLKFLILIVCGVALGWFVVRAIRGAPDRSRIDKHGRDGGSEGGTIIDGTGTSRYADSDRNPDDGQGWGDGSGSDGGGGGGD